MAGPTTTKRTRATATGDEAADELFDLTGRAAIVTGGGTHLGLAMSEAFARHGASVYIVGRRESVLERAAAQLRERGRAVHPLAADAADEAAVAACVEAVLAREGRLDVMVCNAGGAAPAEPFPALTLEDYRATMRMCVDTAVVCAREAARAMIPRRSGRIVLLGSIHGTLGADPRLYAEDFPRSGVAYNAAKGAVVNLARALACELGRWGITVNSLSPGQIPLPGSDPVTSERFRLNNPLMRTGEPHDVAGAALLLASDAGAWITGHDLVVDGGWSAW